jgi:thiamine-phosphate pyrophosphorylase
MPGAESDVTGRVPVLHLVTDDAVLARSDFRACAGAAVEAGGAAVALHLRGPATPGGHIFALAADLRAVASSHGALLVVNDRVDVALAAGVDAVHLGERSLSVPEARMVLGPGARVGASVHDAERAALVAAEGSTWIFVGTLYATPTHPGRPGGGPDLVRGVARVAGAPLVGIGGVTPARVAEVRAAGAHGVAIVRGVWDAPDPARAVRDYLDALA